MDRSFEISLSFIMVYPYSLKSPQCNFFVDGFWKSRYNNSKVAGTFFILGLGLLGRTMTRRLSTFPEPSKARPRGL